MIEYTEQAEMVDALRHCASDGFCEEKHCPYHAKRDGYECIWSMMRDAADMIEALYAKTQEQQARIDEQDEEIAALQREIMTYPAEEIEREERCGL